MEGTPPVVYNQVRQMVPNRPLGHHWEDPGMLFWVVPRSNSLDPFADSVLPCSRQVPVG